MKPFLPVVFSVLLLCGGCAVSPAEDDAALAEKFDCNFYLAGKNTPAEYMVNQSAAPSAEAKAILKGRLIPTETDAAAKARKALQTLDSEVRKGLNWPEKHPPSAVIPFCPEKPRIDGSCTERAWKNALVFLGEYPVSSVEKQNSGTVWKIMWDKEYLYAAAEFSQAAPRSERYDPAAGKAPWRADALELFVGPGIRFRTYWEIVVSPDGVTYDSLGQNNRWGSYLATPEESIRGLRTAARQTSDGYSVEIAVPWREIPGYERGDPPRNGETINFTMIRCRNGEQSSCHPLLYSGHNIFGHLRGILSQTSTE